MLENKLTKKDIKSFQGIISHLKIFPDLHLLTTTTNTMLMHKSLKRNNGFLTLSKSIKISFINAL